MPPHPHFVRCIKPNPLKQPLNYDTAYVLTQLRYKLLEAVYAPPSVSSSSEGKCRAILANVDVEGWACGRSKVMLRFDHSTVLDAQCSFVYIKVVTIQRYIRDWLNRRLK